MDLGIAGKKAIVCASSKGLGKGCAWHLAEADCEVVVNGRDADTTHATAEELTKATGAKIIPVIADISDPEGQKKVLSACPEPDILVNNNGGPPMRDFRDLDREKIIEGVTQNMITPIEMITAVIDPMKEKKFGRIVNITSLSVYMAFEGLDLSSGARAGLTSFLAGIARSYVQHNVTINQILPGKIDTDRIASVFEKLASSRNTTIEEAKRVECEGIPAKRLGTPDEFGAICAFMCSVHAGYITGRNIHVDGGLNMSAF